MAKKKSKVQLVISEGDENSELMQRLEKILRRDKPEVYRQLKQEMESKEKPADS